MITAKPSSALHGLRRFVLEFAMLLDDRPAETEILARGGTLLRRLIAHDDWLPDDFARPHPTHYQQFLLHCDSRERFSVVSFVWGPGQSTPVHNHTVWGLVGILRGMEIVQSYQRRGNSVLAEGPARRLSSGDVEALSPTLGDIHQVSNGAGEKISISIHIYGGNIGAICRSVFEQQGAIKPFVSHYANTLLPNLWDGPLLPEAITE
jgi:predicted metal-dependent enzyme (double-stranded beta helix superfamily)